MNLRTGDVIVLKKEHPCGQKQWLVLQTGEQLRIRCVGCGHEITVPSFKIEKNIRRVISMENFSTDSSGR